VRQRLLELSRKRGEPFDLILTRYGIERLLYRLGMSPYADRFLLKGAMLFRVWEDSSHRPTRDLDLLDFGSAEASDLESIFREVCSLSAEPDGLLFMPASVKARPIREEAVYGGIRVTLEARLENAKIPIQCDIGFGDAVTPEPEQIEFPALLDFPAPHLRAYPIYTVVAEKLEAMVLLGETKSRMKDFYDIWFESALRIRWRHACQSPPRDIHAPENRTANLDSTCLQRGFFENQSGAVGRIPPQKPARADRHARGGRVDTPVRERPACPRLPR
jgi:hypothetical protein